MNPVRSIGLLGRRVLEMVAPAGCAGCGRALPDVRDDVCRRCLAELQSAVSAGYCRRCGFSVGPYHVPGSPCPSCKSRSFRFDGMVRVAAHEGVSRAMVNGFKFGARPHALRPLARYMISAIEGAVDWMATDALVPIPVARRRRLMIGESSVGELARQVGKRLEIPVEELLRVVRPGPPQRGLSATDRWANVRDRFGLARGSDVAGARLCVVDDVSTTGATLHEVARALKAGGAQAVVAAVLTKRDPARASFDE